VIALGFRAHTGWAAMVALRGTAAGPEVVDRRRVDFIEDGRPTAVFHAAGATDLDPAEAEALVRKATESMTRMATVAIGELCRELGGVTSAGVVLGSGRATLDVKRAISSHAGKHAAEGELARQVLVDGSAGAGLEVVGVREKELVERGSSVLGLDPDELRTRIVDLGRPVGAPWTKDQKDAALVAWIALEARRA
jgi:hypothetical protein